MSSPPRGASHSDAAQDATERALAGGPERHREKAIEQGKLPVRDRVALLLDEGSFTEEALLANVKAMIDALNRAKPSGAKGVYIKKISLSSTMGPGFKVDTASAGA